jgi:hypothetical protein
MANFDTKRLPRERDALAPDGSDVRILLGLKGGGMAWVNIWLPPRDSNPDMLIQSQLSCR